MLNRLPKGAGQGAGHNQKNENYKRKKKNLTGKGKCIKQVRRLKDKIIHSKTAYIHNKYLGNTGKKDV